MTKYTVKCVGQGGCVVGDEIQFQRALFTGSFKNARFAGRETIQGKIVNDSYGPKTGQHTFTILLPSGKKTRIKAANLYDLDTKLLRKPWADENERSAALQEKHGRGNAAKTQKELRREYPF